MNKAEIVQKLLDKDQITAEEAVVLLKSEKEVIREIITIEKSVWPVWPSYPLQPYYYTTNYLQYPIVDSAQN